jgi:hypothetical protein
VCGPAEERLRLDHVEQLGHRVGTEDAKPAIDGAMCTSPAAAETSPAELVGIAASFLLY